MQVNRRECGVGALDGVGATNIRKSQNSAILNIWKRVTTKIIAKIAIY